MPNSAPAIHHATYEIVQAVAAGTVRTVATVAGTDAWDAYADLHPLLPALVAYVVDEYDSPLRTLPDPVAANGQWSETGIAEWDEHAVEVVRAFRAAARKAIRTGDVTADDVATLMDEHGWDGVVA